MESLQQGGTRSTCPSQWIFHDIRLLQTAAGSAGALRPAGPFEDGCYQLQRDRSLVHTARIVAMVLENLAIRTVPWPHVGAYLNPIENVWGIVDSRLSAPRCSSATSEALWQAVSED
ncbi:hypothetical protein HPB51_022684 [Rhipicephalus microplus]|uniref:Transposable element n=1 Tax=Rhipicephalus microplus TaxID=6941 RepID=A0A9J6EQG4_RHIMP|nr:hypothetical protein HPB51_022684 [Rhipicephalus microplus]